MKQQSLSAFRGGSLWRDLLLAAAVALLAALLSAQVELHELVFEFTRRWERFQLDEWPMGMLAFASCMVVLYARRHPQLRRALQENRRLVGRMLDVQEQERRRVARELHDELGQTLNAIKLDALALAGGSTTDVPGIAQRIAGNADHVYGAAGDLVSRLRPTALDELGLVAALEAGVERWRRPDPDLAVQLSMGGELDDLGETLNLALYRIVQEATTNCLRHARARHLFIDLTRAPGGSRGLQLEIRDDGVGFDATRATAGSGLHGMRERVALLGGSFQLLSEAGQGVTIRAELPVSKELPWPPP
jgi:two-component system, NarL family, sensor histidine kinase UhpB